MIPAEKLTEQIDILSVTTQRDEYGDPVETWAVIPGGEGVWAQVIAERGTEFVANAQETARRPISACIRYRDDVTDDMRIRWAGDEYEVQSVVKRYRDGEMQIHAEFVEGR